MQIFILNKITRKGDSERHWIFSTQEKVDEFIKKFGLEDNEEESYESYSKAIDPLAL